jgi:hypothetical protein
MRRVRRASVGVCLILLLSGQTEYALAVAGQVWWSILSWDSASTHAVEALASFTPTLRDPVREACERVRAVPPLLAVRLVDAPRAPRDAVLSARITRSPPAPLPS